MYMMAKDACFTKSLMLFKIFFVNNVNIHKKRV